MARAAAIAYAAATAWTGAGLRFQPWAAPAWPVLQGMRRAGSLLATLAQVSSYAVQGAETGAQRCRGACAAEVRGRVSALSLQCVEVGAGWQTGVTGIAQQANRYAHVLRDLPDSCSARCLGVQHAQKELKLSTALRARPAARRRAWCKAGAQYSRPARQSLRVPARTFSAGCWWRLNTTGWAGQ